MKAIIYSTLALSLLRIGVYATDPLGTPDPKTIEYPAGEAPSAKEVELGKILFYDERLSINQTQSCATCHNPDLGFSDGMAKGHGAMGKHVGRNAPHLYNLAWSSIFFWDGRAASLEEQALGPIQAPGEMNMPLDSLLPRLKKVAYYRNSFQSIYGKEGITKDNLGKAIASFERTLITNNSPFDRYLKGDHNAMTPSAVRGMALFSGKANCTACHSGPNFTDESFHNIGVPGDDEGRNKILAGATLKGAFKTPGLRNVTLTGPYMHDGSEKTLEEVVAFYNMGGKNKKNLDKLIKPLGCSEHEMQDLVAFLGALNDPLNVARPEIPKND